MQSNGSVVLVSSSAIINSSTTPVLWNGARGVIVVEAQDYPTALNLQIRGPDGSWITVNDSSYGANTVDSLDLPAGEYRMNINGSTAVGLSAVLLPVR